MKNKRLLALLPALVLPMVLRPLQVQDHAMAPSIQPRDWVLWLPLSPRQGDVVLLQDPADPERAVLRRAVGPPETQVQLQPPAMVVNGQSWRHREMGRSDRLVQYSEQDAWLIQRGQRRFDEPQHSVQAGAGEWVLLADNRDGPTDSRWWGAVPQEQLRGRVWLRIGRADDWRGVLGWRAQDGPWIPPSKQPNDG